MAGKGANTTMHFRVTKDTPGLKFRYRTEFKELFENYSQPGKVVFLSAFKQLLHF